jgi:predicted phage terminase large subunit-like protein
METPSFKIPHPTDWQAAFLQKEEELQPRLITICLGRRGGKSFISLLWVLLNRLGLLAGYSCAWVAPSDNVLGEVRSWVKAWLDPFIVGPSPGALGYRLQNGADLDFWSASPNAPRPLRSRGYACCVIDEAAHYAINLRDTVDAAIRPALALAEGKLLFISTPKGRNDFLYFYEQAQREGLAIHGSSLVNPHFTELAYRRLERVTEPLLFRQEYGAEFVEREGSLLKREQLRHGEPPALAEFRKIAAGLDIALSSKQRADYTALVVTGLDYQGRAWVLHAARWRADWPTTFGRVLSYHQSWNFAELATEKVAFQELALREMIDAGLPVSAVDASKDKETRFGPIHLRYSLGTIWHAQALAGSEFEGELLSFPLSAHDDFVDALVFGLSAVDNRLGSGWNGSNFPRWLDADAPKSFAPGWALGRGGQLLKKLGDGRYEVFR